MKVYFDANYSPYIPKALNLLEFTRNEIEVISTEDKDVLPGASDEDIATYIARQGGILFSKDQDFKKAQFLTELMSTLQLGLFYMKTQKKEEYWHLCSVILKSYIKKCRSIILTKHRPYFYEIMANGNVKSRLI